MLICRIEQATRPASQGAKGNPVRPPSSRVRCEMEIASAVVAPEDRSNMPIAVIHFDQGLA